MIGDIRAKQVLVVLQNAYDKGTLAEGYSFARWLKEMERSRVGQRLEVIFQSLRAPRWTNTTPVVGCGPDAKLPACPAHLRRAFRRAQPRILLACGLQAEEACVALWPGDLVAMPHPAYRVLTNDLLDHVSHVIGWRLAQLESPTMRASAVPKRFYYAPYGRLLRMAFRQGRGIVIAEPLSGHNDEANADAD